MVFARRSAWVFLALAIFPAAHCTAEEKVREAPWEELSHYPCRGLSPLYRPTARRLEEILAEPNLWEVLPRPVTGVVAREDQPPCFEMQSGDWYYNSLPATAAAVRWAAEQRWTGGFRLLYNAGVLAFYDRELWTTPQGGTRVLEFYSSGGRALYRPFGSDWSFGRNRLARDGGDAWWVASSEGVFRLQDDYWERAKIPNWPGGAAGGILDDSKGRLVAWSEREVEGAATVAFNTDGKWTSVRVPRSGNWTQGGIRADGSAVLMSAAEIVIVSPSDDERIASEPERDTAGPMQIVDPRSGRFDVGEDGWVLPRGARAVARDGNVLFGTESLSEGRFGLVRIPSDGAAHWIEFAPSRELRIVPFPDGGFLLLEPTMGVLLLTKDSRHPERVAEAGDVLLGDEPLGCDRDGHLYIKRDFAVMMLSPRAKKPTARGVKRLAECPERSRFSVPFGVAVDSSGCCWFVRSSDGAVMVRPPQGDLPVLRDDRLSGAVSLWAGRQGAMLVLLADGRAALAHSRRELETAESLVALAREHTGLMLAAAPCASHDPRRGLDDGEYGQRHQPLAAPWLTTGEFLWLADGKAVYRIGPDSAEADSAASAKVAEGDFALLGPLHSGRLLLAKRTGNRYSQRVTEWLWIDDPGGAVRLEPVAAPPREHGKSYLQSPASFADDWLLDTQGRLWLHQGFDRVYRIDSRETWSLLQDFGRPQFVHPDGFVWAYRAARVFAGFEVAVSDAGRSCIPTYMEHLTPLFGDGNQITCLTPTGLADLHFDPRKPEEDAITRRFHVRWGAKPSWYIGRSDRSVFFVVGRDSSSALVAVELPEPEHD